MPGRQGSAPFPYSQPEPQAQCPFCIPLFPAGSSAGSARSPGEGGDPSTHRDPQPGQEHLISCQSLAASNRSNHSLARAIPVESPAALVLPRLFFHALISCMSDLGTAGLPWLEGIHRGWRWERFQSLPCRAKPGPVNESHFTDGGDCCLSLPGTLSLTIPAPAVGQCSGRSTNSLSGHITPGHSSWPKMLSPPFTTQTSLGIQEKTH